MSDFDRSGLTIDTPSKRRPVASRFGDLGERLSRTFGGFDQARAELPAWESDEHLDFPLSDETVAFTPADQRFPIVRHGYDPVEVDRRFDELEAELQQLRTRKPAATAIAKEIDRIGEQTSAILQTAYEQAAEITRSARAEADKCVADAAANAVSITEDANRRLRELDVETDSIWQERARLIEDARNVADAMMSLANGAMDRFPPEGAKPSQVPQPVAAAITAQDLRGTQVSEAGTPEDPATGGTPE